MPILPSHYYPPFVFKNGHLSTIYSGIVRKVTGVQQKRERITLPDGDFLDLDWSCGIKTSEKLMVVLHGLEGNAQRPYMTAMAKKFTENNFDAVCVNFRGCSGSPNLLFRSYHSGATEDLDAVLQHILNTKAYTQIYISGFSLGGNVLLKYLGEYQSISSKIKGAVAVSVPCDLYGSMLELHTFKNVLYANRFKKHLIEKLKEKQHLFPERVSNQDIKKVQTLKDFDDVYTAPAHGFKDALDYYKKSSSLQFLNNIKTPTLVLNALNDSFLSPSCFPINEAKSNAYLFLETPLYGGHVGFYQKGYYYNEEKALHFISNYCL